MTQLFLVQMKKSEKEDGKGRYLTYEENEGMRTIECSET